MSRELVVGKDGLFSERLAGVVPKVRQLYIVGSFDDGWWKRVVAIVGSRRMTNYGKRVVEKIVPVLVNSGITIVSGMMYGVDQEVHRVCLECDGKTAAVVGWGIDWRVSDQDQSLYKKIEQNGMILSEYAGKFAPRKYTFLERNRIVAGLADGVVIIEGALQSGSLVTAKLAEKMGKLLMAVPGPVTSGVSEGTNQLIKDGRAKMVRNGEDVMEALGWECKKENSGKFEGGGIMEKLLRDEELSVDELAVKLGKTAKEVMVMLSGLQLEGLVDESNGKFYWRK